MKKLLLSSVAVALLLVGCNNTPSKTAEATQNNDVKVEAKATNSAKSVKVTGIREAGLEQGSQNLDKIEYTTQAPIPGQVKLIEKSFVTAPPMIPHNISGMTPIKIGQNQCIACHMPASAKGMGITAIPESHFKSAFSHESGKLAGSRYNCTQCHAKQATLDPVVENKFNSLRK